jgi:hypothetical protein
LAALLGSVALSASAARSKVVTAISSPGSALDAS